MKKIYIDVLFVTKIVKNLCLRIVGFSRVEHRTGSGPKEAYQMKPIIQS